VFRADADWLGLSPRIWTGACLQCFDVDITHCGFSGWHANENIYYILMGGHVGDAQVVIGIVKHSVILTIE
jgi:hypothetical protein